MSAYDPEQTPTGGSGANYEVRVSLISGTFTSGTAGTWLSLASTQSWATSRSATGSKATSATFEIRDALALTVVTSADITLQATIENSQ